MLVHAYDDYAHSRKYLFAGAQAELPASFPAEDRGLVLGTRNDVCTVKKQKKTERTCRCAKSMITSLYTSGRQSANYSFELFLSAAKAESIPDVYFVTSFTPPTVFPVIVSSCVAR